MPDMAGEIRLRVRALDGAHFGSGHANRTTGRRVLRQNEASLPPRKQVDAAARMLAIFVGRALELRFDDESGLAQFALDGRRLPEHEIEVHRHSEEVVAM